MTTVRSGPDALTGVISTLVASILILAMPWICKSRIGGNAQQTGVPMLGRKMNDGVTPYGSVWPIDIVVTGELVRLMFAGGIVISAAGRPDAPPPGAETLPAWIIW